MFLFNDLKVVSRLCPVLLPPSNRMDLDFLCFHSASVREYFFKKTLLYLSIISLWKIWLLNLALSAEYAVSMHMDKVIFIPMYNIYWKIQHRRFRKSPLQFIIKQTYTLFTQTSLNYLTYQILNLLLDLQRVSTARYGLLSPC